MTLSISKLKENAELSTIHTCYEGCHRCATNNFKMTLDTSTVLAIIARLESAEDALDFYLKAVDEDDIINMFGNKARAHFDRFKEGKE